MEYLTMTLHIASTSTHETNLNPICALLLRRQALLMCRFSFSCTFGSGPSFSTDTWLVHKKIGKSLGQRLSVEFYRGTTTEC